MKFFKDRFPQLLELPFMTVMILGLNLFAYQRVVFPEQLEQGDPCKSYETVQEIPLPFHDFPWWHKIVASLKVCNGFQKIRKSLHMGIDYLAWLPKAFPQKCYRLFIFTVCKGKTSHSP